MGHSSGLLKKLIILRRFTATAQKNKYIPPKFKSKEFQMVNTTLRGKPLDRQVLDSMLRRRMFYTPSFEIYNGVGGLYDYGPPGCALQANIIDIWRKHFVIEEDMLEVDCSSLTPEEVLKTSGHVEKFADWMCKDPKNGEILRADHFVEEILTARLRGDKEARGSEYKEKEDNTKKKKKNQSKSMEAVKLEDLTIREYEEILAKVDNLNGPQLWELIVKYEMKNPATGVLPSEPVEFNLMFQTSIGPSSNAPGYLRPETAQGQFINFSKLLEFNQHQMPFASASIGKAFRNEISPRAGLLRVREFLMAEIEYFIDPDSGKKHNRFDEVKNTELVFLNRHTQLAGQTKVDRTTIGQSVADGTVANETLGYFLARIHLFLRKIGVDQSKIRFRQHMENEMAHYATDCWDAELLTSYGWIECVGCADRSAYDLSVHAKKTGAPLIVRERLEPPISIEEWHIEIDKKKFGPHFKKNGKIIEAFLEALPEAKREALANDLTSNSEISVNIGAGGLERVKIPKELITIARRTRVENTREYIPNVIEPSFGIGRILYALLEHNYWSRDSEGGDEARGVLSFPPIVAPTKVLLVPLSSHNSFRPLVKHLSIRLRSMGLASRVDDSSASIGKRYSRNDELGTPLGITIDFQSVKDNTFTLRDRDSTRQVRADEQTLLMAVTSLVEGNKTWTDIERELPVFQGQDVDPLPC